MKTFAATFAVVLVSGLVIAYPSDIEERQATNGPDPGTIIWICTDNTDTSVDIPDVCKNMCYGAFCRGYGTSLTWDNYAGNTKATRATNAGCGNNNHCSDGTGANQCDEYPFGSTSDADRTDLLPVNRCVPRGQNARQGARLSQLFRSTGPWSNNQGLNGNAPAQFEQTFSNAGTLQYCSDSSDDCDPDGNEWDRNGEITDDDDSRRRAAMKRDSSVPTHRSYRLLSGMRIRVPNTFAKGHKVLIPSTYNETLFAEQSESHVYDPNAGLEQYDYMTDNLYFANDEVDDEVDDE